MTLHDWLTLDWAGWTPLPAPVAEAVAEVAPLLGTDSDPSRADPLGMAVRAALGELLGCDGSDVFLTRGTAHAVWLLVRGLDWRPGEALVVAERHPLARALPAWLPPGGAAAGVELRTTADASAAGLLAAVDARTRLVLAADVDGTTGERTDLAALADGCARRGASLAVTADHGLGALHHDVRALGLQFLAAEAHRWLMGPSGIGLSYIAPSLSARVAPTLVGTNSVTTTDNLDPLLALRPDAGRYQVAYDSTLDLTAWRRALGLRDGLASTQAEELILAKAERLRSGLAALGYRPLGEAGGPPSPIVVLDGSDPRTARLRAALAAERIAAGDVAGGLRLAPHFFTPDEDVARAIGVAAAVG